MRRNITPKVVPELQKNVFAEISFETWCLDTLDPLPLSGGNKYVVVCVDVRTSLVVLEPVPDVTSEIIVNFYCVALFLIWNVSFSIDRLSRAFPLKSFQPTYEFLKGEKTLHQPSGSFHEWNSREQGQTS
ncbi:hypothetical protein QYM36_003759 [Artemia franciscana]|uniref:Uncharacterized protein n=1 Tax=Artemia franciscana TaxID=6661 RepID=A0AA88LH77_ARTSF|nr:hypothetical protein QYM36_003759 [Artemia franciscana]